METKLYSTAVCYHSISASRYRYYSTLTISHITTIMTLNCYLLVESLVKANASAFLFQKTVRHRGGYSATNTITRALFLK